MCVSALYMWFSASHLQPEESFASFSAEAGTFMRLFDASFGPGQKDTRNFRKM